MKPTQVWQQGFLLLFAAAISLTGGAVMGGVVTGILFCPFGLSDSAFWVGSALGAVALGPYLAGRALKTLRSPNSY